jgi:hypothetical protein
VHRLATASGKSWCWLTSSKVSRVADTLDSREEGGRGLILVHELADSWGTRLRREGKEVWFRLPMEKGTHDGGVFPTID